MKTSQKNFLEVCCIGLQKLLKADHFLNKRSIKSIFNTRVFFQSSSNLVLAFGGLFSNCLKLQKYLFSRRRR